MKRRSISILTALALCLSLCPAWTFAAETDTGLCTHHPAHTEACYTLDGDTENLLDGQHTLESGCGYVCHICPVEDLIAALPGEVTGDNRAQVRAQLDVILDLYRDLTADEQEQADLAHVLKLQAELDAANVPAPAAEGTADTNICIDTSRVNIYFTDTACGGSCQGHKITQSGASGAGKTTRILVESGTHNIIFSGLSLTGASVGVMPGAMMNLTIEGENTIQGTYSGIYVPVGASLVITEQSTGSLTVSSGRGAGIGGAMYSPAPTETDSDMNCGTVVINGGTITANGAAGCAGIGGALKGASEVGSGGNVTINGGTVTAKGSGSGSNLDSYGGAGIGGAATDGISGSGGTLTINGGQVTLDVGTHNDAGGVSYGFGRGRGSNADADAGTLTLADESYLTLVEGTTLDPEGTYFLSYGDPTEDMIVVPEDLVYTGQPFDLNGKIYIDISKPGTTTLFGQKFNVLNASADGWQLQPLGEVVNVGTYTAVFKNGDKTISKTFTVECGHADSALTYEAQEDGATHKKTCQDCGKIWDAESHTLGTDNRCSNCNVQLAAQVDINGTATCYTTIEAAWAAAKGKTATVTLLDNAEIREALEIVDGDTITFDGGTYTLTIRLATANAYAITLNGGKLAMQSGTITSEGILSNGVKAAGGTFVFTRGKIEASDNGINAAGGIVQISGGETSGGTGLFCNGTGTVQISGGTFTGTSHAVYHHTGKVSSLLGHTNTTRYAYYQGSNPVTSGLDGKDLPAGTYTVAECSHAQSVCEYQPIDGTKTHKKTCLACGYTEREDCTYGAEYGHDETGHWRTCTACDGQKPEAHTLGTEYGHDNTSHWLTCTACGWKKSEAHTIASHTSEASGTAVTLIGVCGLCGNANELSTVTFTFPALVYGQTEADLTWTDVPEGYLLFLGIDSGGQWNVQGNSQNIAQLYSSMLMLPAGGHTLKVIFDCNAIGSYSESELPFHVDKATLTPTLTGTTTKTYDGTKDAPADLTVALNGLVDGDNVTAAAVSEYDSPNAGERTVTAKNITLRGADADNYQLSDTSASISGSITKSTPTIAFAEGYHPDKIYDGQTIPDPTADDLTITGAGLTDVTFTWSGTPQNAGSYTLTAAIPATDNTEAAGTEALTVTISPKPVISPAVTLSPDSFTYTGSEHRPAVTVKDGETVIPDSEYTVEYSGNINAGTASVTVKDKDGGNYAISGGTFPFTITRAAPSLTLSPSSAMMPNGGTVTLTLSGLPEGGTADVTCSEEGIRVTEGAGGVWTAVVPNRTAAYTFTAAYAGNGNYAPASASCTVETKEVIPLPDQPAGDGEKKLLVVMEEGLSKVPEGLKEIDGLETPEKLETAMKTAIKEVSSDVAQENTAVYDVTLLVSTDGGSTWSQASKDNFPADGKLTVTLPYPEGTDDRFRFTVVHMFTTSDFGKVPGKTEKFTPEQVENTANGIQFVVTGLSPISVGWEKKDNTPPESVEPDPPKPDTPEEPDIPDKPDTPEEPDTPDKPDTPEEPDTPDKPDTPEEPDIPGKPDTPEEPDTPTKPDTPTEPTTPTRPTGGGGGGSSHTSTYAVTVEKSGNGNVTASRTNASSGSAVTLTVTPDSGYVLDTLTVTDSRGNEISLTEKGSGQYTFTMPGRAVTVKAAFASLPDDAGQPSDGAADCPSHGYADLGPVGTWYHEAVDYVLQNGLMSGYNKTSFGPDDTLSRAQLAQILYNIEGRPAVTSGSSFVDVANGQWYAPAVTWAAAGGIVGGYGNGTFGPDDSITREQLAVMLWRYAGSPAATNKELHFTDADKADGWALDALCWAVENGILNGYGDGQLDPGGPATRAQAAQMLKNFLENK